MYELPRGEQGRDHKPVQHFQANFLHPVFGLGRGGREIGQPLILIIFLGNDGSGGGRVVVVRAVVVV